MSQSSEIVDLSGPWSSVGVTFSVPRMTADIFRPSINNISSIIGSDIDFNSEKNIKSFTGLMNGQPLQKGFNIEITFRHVNQSSEYVSFR